MKGHGVVCTDLGDDGDAALKSERRHGLSDVVEGSSFRSLFLQHID